MKKMKCFRFDHSEDEKLAMEARRQRMLTGINLTDSDLIKFYISEGLKSKKQYNEEFKTK